MPPAPMTFGSPSQPQEIIVHGRVTASAATVAGIDTAQANAQQTADIAQLREDYDQLVATLRGLVPGFPL